MLKNVELVLGGARSGKSRYAEQQAKNSIMDEADTIDHVLYVATATVYDDEMAQRVERHKLDRPMAWQTIEEPIQLADVLKQNAKKNRCLLVDCLTLWLTNLLMLEDEAEFKQQKTALIETLQTLPGRVLLVSNEVGHGIVPMGALSRRFVDEAGWLHQDIAALSDKVTLVVAGIPMVVKD